MEEKLVNKSEQNFTPKQMEVLEHECGNLLVSASAGSGKTRVLIEKIVRLITNKGVDLKHLLALTFTNSASLEIKQRLYDALSKSKDSRLIAQIEDLSTSDISTIDSFCIKIVKEFGYTVGQNSNFSVADESLSNFLKNQALDNIFANHNNQFDAKFINFVSNFFESRNEKSVRQTIVRLYDFLKSKQDDEIYLDKLENLYTFNDENEAIIYANKYLQKLKASVLKSLDTLKLKCNMICNEKLTNKVLEASGLVNSYKFDILSEYLYLANGIDFPEIRHSPKETVEEGELITEYNAVKKLLNEKLSYILPQELSKLSKDKLIADLENTKRTLKYIFTIVKEFEKEYVALKKNHSLLDFNDIERLAKNILENDQIKTTLQNRYDYIFVDEYQDTSALQEGIISKITTGENLFMVGDLKQSIYRFRQAEPSIFINKYNQYKQMKTSGKTIELATNFRSEDCILKFNNFIFDKIYKESIDEYEYKGNADLKFGGTVQKSTNSSQIKVFLLDDLSEKEEEKSEIQGVYSVKDSTIGFGKDENIKKQALFLANQIKDMLGKPYYDSKEKCCKPLTYGDIAVLSRAKSGVMQELKKWLKLSNIPATAEVSQNLFSTYDMQILKNILSAIDNPQNDIPIMSALVNLGDVTLDELAKIRNFDRKEKYFYKAMQNYLDANANEITEKIYNCLKKLDDYRHKSTHLNVAELINHIVINENFEVYFAINDYAEEFKNHLDSLISSTQSIKDFSLSEYLNYIYSFAGDITYSMEAKDGEDAVTLSTIHASKGLEYPVVFLIGAEKGFSNKNQVAKIIMDNDWGISMPSFDNDAHTSYSGLINQIFKLKIELEDKREEKRLLYVALTRAKNYLNIIGSIDVDKLESIESDFDIADAKSYLDWIVGVLPQEKIEKLKNDGVVSVDDGGDEFEYCIFDANAIDLKGNDDTSTTMTNLVIDAAEMFDTLSQKFEHSQFAKKNTVTQIMQEGDHYNITDFSYKKTDVGDDTDFLSVGNAYHKFMELLDFSKQDEISRQVDEFLSLNKITNDEKNLVDIEKVRIAINKIGGLISNQDKVLKEHQFLLYMPAKELIKTNSNSKILVQGVADLIIEKENEIYLIDYKTSRLSSDEKFAEKYTTQLDIYAKAIENFYRKKVTKKMIYSFYLNKLVTI